MCLLPVLLGILGAYYYCGEAACEMDVEKSLKGRGRRTSHARPYFVKGPACTLMRRTISEMGRRVSLYFSLLVKLWQPVRAGLFGARRRTSMWHVAGGRLLLWVRGFVDPAAWAKHFVLDIFVRLGTWVMGVSLGSCVV
ncbi:hypothetical protein BDY21DRAFT_62688 [Lineolata rhizophorae]|uniref:Secreted protein n=1 Tax=Lineolata rhizophorae TaxID=578093 RepID=A0A6A6NWD0_9PEZI|nr:hypothetical protein BDY21DRAFT_62688 [Lineolata rhizophorae]